MPQSPGPEGIVFGAGDHLPDACALAGFDFVRAKKVLGSNAIAEVPGRSDCVVRQHSTPYLNGQGQRATKADYYEIAREGVRHFTAMTDAGLQLPAQRLVVTHDRFGPALYGFTERIDGQPLTDKHGDRYASALVIDGLSKYCSWVRTSGTTEFLWDKVFPWQHTLTTNGLPMLHDVGLDFRRARTRLGMRSSLLHAAARSLKEWSDYAGLRPPQSLRRLLREEPIFYKGIYWLTMLPGNNSQPEDDD